MRDLLADLNDAQKKAVTHGPGPLLVVAGPGSGKTRVVSRRVAWLLREGARPSEILAVTFTNKAANELKERVAALAPAAGLWVGTFHSACARILRENHAAAGYPASFTIYDEEDRRRLAGRVLRELGIPPERWKPAAVLRRISDWKNAGQGPVDAAKGSFSPRDEEIAKVYARFEEVLASEAAMDFDDLLLKAHRLLEKDAAVLERYRDRLRWVLVDEYQDTNRVQFLLSRALASATKNLTATGDPDQSIYGWRGADIRNILDFQEHYPDAAIVRLERNYRSTDPILEAAGHLIRRNQGRHAKDLLGRGEAGPAVRVEIFEGADEEGEGVAAAVAEALGLGFAASDLAILYRVNARSRAVERALIRRRIPYQVLRGVEFYQRAEVKDLVGWLRLLGNPRDAEALARILQAPRKGAGAATAESVLLESARRGLPAREALLLGAEGLGLRGRPGKGIDFAAGVIRDLLAAPPEGVHALLEEILARTGYRTWVEENWPEDHPERWENVAELLAAAATHDARGEEGRGLQGFLEEAALVSDQDRYAADAPRVVLMTLHTCKGLEFPGVFVIGVEEGVLPHARSTRQEFGGEDAAGVEEERRLLFVGMTRARKRLWLSAALRASGWTGGASGPSRFLQEIGGRTAVRAPAPREESVFSFDPDPDPGDDGAGGAGESLRVGQRVRHEAFGTGRVRRLEHRGRSVRATVEFRNGVKTLDLDFTRLDPLGDGA